MTSGVTDISAGSYHTCAIQDGAAKCWGAARWGQIGDGGASQTMIDTVSVVVANRKATRPVQVVGLTSGVTDISSGSRHTCAIQDGAAKCWGEDYYGELGWRTQTGYLSFVQSASLSSPHSVEGGLNLDVTLISASGFRKSCAVKNGTITCWSNWEICITGACSGLQPSPIVLASPVHYGISQLEDKVITDIFIGYALSNSGYNNYSCAVANNQELYCWGDNQHGQLGLGHTDDTTVPTNPVDFSTSSGARGLVGPPVAPRKIILAD